MVRYRPLPLEISPQRVHTLLKQHVPENGRYERVIPREGQAPQFDDVFFIEAANSSILLIGIAAFSARSGFT